MDPVTLTTWITLGLTVGSYVLHAVQARRGGGTAAPVQPAAPAPQLTQLLQQLPALLQASGVQLPAASNQLLQQLPALLQGVQLPQLQPSAASPSVPDDGHIRIGHGALLNLLGMAIRNQPPAITPPVQPNPVQPAVPQTTPAAPAVSPVAAS